METLFQDLRYALRALRRTPGFTAIAILCLTLGIAVNTTIFSVFYTIVLKPFDFREPEQLVVIEDFQPREGGDAPVSYLTYRDVAQQITTFEALAAETIRSLAITEGDEPERLEGAAISWNLFPMLGIRPQLGRWFREDEDQIGAPPVVLLSDELWRRRYNADSTIVGRAISINGLPHTVIGVMPPRFKFPQTNEIWVTGAQIAANERRTDRSFILYGRLKRGVTLAAANAELANISRRLYREHSMDREGWMLRGVPLREAFVPSEISLVTVTMMGAVTFVLLIACANVANLLLTRATARQREIAIRAAIGAGRRRIVRQLLTESAVLALIAGMLAIPLTWLGLTLVDMGIPANDQVPYYLDWSVDGATLGYTLLISLVTGGLFGLAPAAQAAKGDLQGALKDGGRGAGTGIRKNRLRSTLVIGEVALSLVLLVGASLFVRSFLSLQTFDVGFNTAPIMTMRFYLPGVRYDSVSSRTQAAEELVRRVEALPGVQGAAISNLIPMGGGGGGGRAVIEGRHVEPGEEPFMQLSSVIGHWFETLGVPLLRGRDFTDAEGRDSIPVAVINQTMAAEFWPGQEALGQRFRLSHDSLTWFTVIGIARDFRNYGPSDDAGQRPAAYVPYKYASPRNHGLMVRTNGPPAAITAAVREHIRAVDAGIPVFNVMTMEETRRATFWQYGLFGSMFSVFGGLALLLAAIGIYGVISFGVAQRTQEIGVRVALGAQRAHVLGMVVRQGLMLAGIGVGFGLLGAWGVTRVIRTLLFGVTATDPLSFVAVTFFLTAVAAVASWFPARRATRVDPIVALRAD